MHLGDAPAFQVRRARPSDAAALSKLGRVTFVETFLPDNRPSDIDAYVQATFSPELQERELNDVATVVLLAEAAGRAVGYVQMHTGASPDCVEALRPLEVQRLYVLGAWHHGGVGPALLHAAFDHGRKLGHDVVWLGVWERNFRAQAFYAKHGFRRVGSHAFQLGSDAQTDWLLLRSLET